MHDTIANPIFRVLALIYDSIIVFVIMLAISAVAVSLNDVKPLSSQLATYLNTLAYGLIIASYFILSWHRGGQTIGMRTWRLKLWDADEQPTISYPRLLKRLGLGLICLVLLGLPLLFAYRRADRQAFYDLACDTAIYRVVIN